MSNLPNNNVNGTVVPFNNYPYQPGVQPAVMQPVIQPIVQQPVGQLVPMPYSGHNTAMDYLGAYPPPAYGGYPDYGMYPRSVGGSPRVYIPRRKRGRMARMMEALFLGGEVDRLRMLEMQAGMGEYGYGMGGMGGMYGARGMGMMDDGYGYGYGSRGMRGYGYHARGCRCPECMEDYF